MLPRFCVEGQTEAGAVPLGQVDVAVLYDGLRQTVEDAEPERRHVVETSTLDSNDWAEIEAAAKMAEGAAEKIRAALGKI